MKIIKSNLDDCLIIEPNVYEDERGFFLETFNENKYKPFINKYKFVQDNHSRSKKNILRGLHFQIQKPQGKLVRVVSGEVFDVAVDLRKESNTFGHWESFILSEENKRQVWIPPGFAHGFLTLSDYADFEYKCTDFYDPKDEGCIIWNDPDLSIKWASETPTLSLKDSQGVFFKDYK